MYAVQHDFAKAEEYLSKTVQLLEHIGHLYLEQYHEELTGAGSAAGGEMQPSTGDTIVSPKETAAHPSSSILPIRVCQPAACGHQFLVKGVHGEAAFEFATRAALSNHFVRLQINADLHAAAVAGQGEEPVNVRFGQLDCENAAVEHVLPEDAGETLSDHHVDAVDFQGPDRVLAGRAAAKVGACHQHLSLLKGWVLGVELFAIENEVFQQMRLQGALSDLSQILGRNDLVGVDVASVYKVGVTAELLHGFRSPAGIRNGTNRVNRVR